MMLEWAFPSTIGGLIDALGTEIGHLVSPLWWKTHWAALINIIMIDVVLAGDNAIVVGMAASRVDPKVRAKVIFWGITAAVFLRIIFAATTAQLLQIVGLTLAGGILLLWVCWKMYRQLVEPHDHHDISSVEASTRDAEVRKGVAHVSVGTAIWQITLADVSMSLDNVLAVAGASKGSTLVLVIGLGVAIVLMAIASVYIAKLLHRYPWITWIGLLIILYVALDMIYTGSHQVSCETWGIGCKERLLDYLKASAGLGHH
ncbi:MAG: TerC family protein [Hyphomicrobiaceae bacterium]